MLPKISLQFIVKIDNHLESVFRIIKILTPIALIHHSLFEYIWIIFDNIQINFRILKVERYLFVWKNISFLGNVWKNLVFIKKKKTWKIIPISRLVWKFDCYKFVPTLSLIMVFPYVSVAIHILFSYFHKNNFIFLFIFIF